MGNPVFYAWHRSLHPDPSPVGLLVWSARTLTYFPVEGSERGADLAATIRQAQRDGRHPHDLLAYWREKGGPHLYEAFDHEQDTYGETIYEVASGCSEAQGLPLGAPALLFPRQATLRDDLERARELGMPGSDWALAWYLAAELMQRLYISHGIAAVAIHREHMGYYGIVVRTCPCRVHREARDLGRLTAAGNVENWRTGGPGDHGLELVDRFDAGEAVDSFVAEAIAHLDLPAVPPKSHYSCRHHRWGRSAVLVFTLVARLAVRHGRRVRIENADLLTRREAAALDPHADQREHLGWTVLWHEDQKLVLANDGRCLEPSAGSLWDRYMAGTSEARLVEWLEGLLLLR